MVGGDCEHWGNGVCGLQSMRIDKNGNCGSVKQDMVYFKEQLRRFNERLVGESKKKPMVVDVEDNV